MSVIFLVDKRNVSKISQFHCQDATSHCFFKTIKQMVIHVYTTTEQISPQTFYCLVVYTFASDHASSSRSSIWMIYHETGNIHVFSTFVRADTGWKTMLINSRKEGIQDCTCVIVGTTRQESNFSTITINPAVTTSLGPSQLTTGATILPNKPRHLPNFIEKT